jgi:hypothetical protein
VRFPTDVVISYSGDLFPELKGAATMLTFLRRGLPIGAALIAIAGLTPSSRADLVIDASDGTTTVELARVSNGSGLANVFASNLFGGFTVALTAISKPFGNSPEQATLQNETLQITNTGGSGKTLTISMTDTGFTYPFPKGDPLVVTSSVNGTLNNLQQGNNVSFQSFMDVNNQEFGKTQTTGAQGPFAYNGIANTTIGALDQALFGGTQATVNGNFAWDPSINPAYSITSQFVLTLSAGAVANLSGTTSLSPTPEPATAVMAAAGIPLVVFGAWLRRRCKAKVGVSG